MPAWLIALLSGAAGALVGGAGATVVSVVAESMNQRRERRARVLTSMLPSLDSSLADHYHAGSYRGDLKLQLESVGIHPIDQ